ncbi:chaplin [Streptantibioticus ferralitis]|uniref:Chaplin n=1 Tax=Streptantibioticus ferralitis TaxID=236510 RepID=A0ABT5YX03_9ACTN|nr:chaplin [Streptantibioticus ferralitis]MDF2256137.1 chaplin [Streptantibioticus ferralitis]
MKRIITATALAAATCAAVIGAAGAASAGEPGGAHAAGFAVGSPGILSGDVVQVPVNIPINVCGNTFNAVGLLNPAIGNVCK